MTVNEYKFERISTITRIYNYVAAQWYD